MARLRGIPPLLLLLLLAGLFWINAWQYLVQIANPVVTADSWYFLEAFIAPWDDGGLSWRDFFKKRDAGDHAQPLHRLLLLWNAERHGLDFGFEARVGFFGMTACLALVLGIALRHFHVAGGGLGQLTWPVALVMALLPGFAFSLNSVEIYYWSLVVFFHVSLFPALVLMAFVAWCIAPAPQGTDRRQVGPAMLLIASGLSVLVQLALDSAGAIVVLALCASLAFAALRCGSWKQAFQLAGAVLAGWVAYRWTYDAVMGDLAPGIAGGMGDALSGLASRWKEAPAWLLLPAVSSLVHPPYLDIWMPGHAGLARGLLGCLVLALHGAFWWSVLRDRVPAALTLFALALMLVVYGLVAGILITRVPLFGSEYLLQRRYIAFYQFANLALVLQLLVVLSRPLREGARPARWVRSASAIGMVILMLALQQRVSDQAWQQEPSIRAYSAYTAGTVYCLSRHPELETPVCEAGNAGCTLPPARRSKLLELMQRRQLNVFAPGFLERHDMVRAVSAETCLPPVRAIHETS